MNQQQLDLEGFRAKVIEAQQAGVAWAVDPAMILGLCETVINLQTENAQLRAELAELNRLQEINRDFIERMRKY